MHSWLLVCLWYIVVVQFDVGLGSGLWLGLGYGQTKDWFSQALEAQLAASLPVIHCSVDRIGVG